MASTAAEATTATARPIGERHGGVLSSGGGAGASVLAVGVGVAGVGDGDAVVGVGVSVVGAGGDGLAVLVGLGVGELTAKVYRAMLTPSCGALRNW